MKFGVSIDLEGQAVGPLEERYVVSISNYINHSCNPNVWFSEDADSWVARRSIKAGVRFKLLLFIYSNHLKVTSLPLIMESIAWSSVANSLVSVVCSKFQKLYSLTDYHLYFITQGALNVAEKWPVTIGWTCCQNIACAFRWHWSRSYACYSNSASNRQLPLCIEANSPSPRTLQLWNTSMTLLLSPSVRQRQLSLSKTCDSDVTSVIRFEYNHISTY